MDFLQEVQGIGVLLSSMEDNDYENLPTERVTIHLVAGGMAGVMEHCVMYPVDCVKV